jgi:hypothetical protein
MIPYQILNWNVGGADSVRVFIQKMNELPRLTA